jgi:hypothetical protein
MPKKRSPNVVLREESTPDTFARCASPASRPPYTDSHVFPWKNEDCVKRTTLADAVEAVIVAAAYGFDGPFWLLGEGWALAAIGPNSVDGLVK